MGKVYVVGTLDTKRAEHEYVRDLIRAAGVETVLVDVGTTDRGGEADVTAAEIAAFRPDGVSAVFVEDRGESVTAMSHNWALFTATAAWSATAFNICRSSSEKSFSSCLLVTLITPITSL